MNRRKFLVSSVVVAAAAVVVCPAAEAQVRPIWIHGSDGKWYAGAAVDLHRGPHTSYSYVRAYESEPDKPAALADAKAELLRLLRGVA